MPRPLFISGLWSKVFTTLGDLGESVRGNSGWGLLGQAELELIDQKLEFGFGLCVASELDLSAIRCGQMEIDHLDSGELFQGAAGGQSWGEGMEASCQGDLQAIGQEGDEDMSFYPLLVLMEDRADGEVALEGLEGLFDGDELNVILP